MQEDHDEALIKRLMQVHGISRENAIEYLNEAYKFVLDAILAGKPVVMASPEEVRRIEQAQRSGSPIPKDLAEKFLDPRSDMWGQVTASIQVKDSR